MSETTFQRGFDRVHRNVIVVAKGMTAHLPPDQFLRVALRAVRRQPVHREVVRYDQLFGLMPARSIHKHQDVHPGDAAGRSLPGKKTWPKSWRCPTPDRIAHPSKPGFILERQAQRLAGVSSRDRVHVNGDLRLDFFILGRETTYYIHGTRLRFVQPQTSPCSSDIAAA